MRVFVAGMMHETNSFSPIPTTRTSFEETFWLRPSMLRGDHLATAKERLSDYPGYGEFVREAARLGDDVVFGPAAFAIPSAPAPHPVYEEIRDAILEDLSQAQPVDLVLLMLHGAQLSDRCDDCEGDLLQAIRRMVGTRTPIGVLLDLHGLISEEMVEAADVMLACKEYPHTDFAQRAQLTYQLTLVVAHGHAKPATAFRRVPMLAMHHPTRQPMRGLVDRTSDMEQQGQALAVSLLHGFPWADSTDGCASVLVVGNSRVQADRVADELVRPFFDLRAEVQSRLLTIDQALSESSAEGPVVISDGSDNCGGGAASDSTYLLHALRDRGLKNSGVGIVWDPETVARARSLGQGGTAEFAIGGKAGPLSGRPFECQAKVRAIADDIIQGGFFEKSGKPLGAAALEADGITILVSGRRQQCVDPEAFRCLGLKPETFSRIIVKSSQHFYANFAAVAGKIVYCDGPGSLTQDFKQLPFRRVRRPIWPLDDIAFDGATARRA